MAYFQDNFYEIYIQNIQIKFSLNQTLINKKYFPNTNQYIPKIFPKVFRHLSTIPNSTQLQ